MSFRSLVYVVVIAPFVVLSAINVYSLQQVIGRYEKMLQRAEDGRVQAVVGGLNDLMVKLDRSALSLSRPREIRHALEAADNAVLFDWSDSFLNGFDSVIFCDMDGMVISRAPDEFRFGDSMAGTRYFRRTLETGAFRGLAELDGRLCLAVSRLIRKYNDVPVGLVVVSVYVTPPMLARLVPDAFTVLTVDGPGGAVASAVTQDPMHRREGLGPLMAGVEGAEAFGLDILQDAGHLELIGLKRSLARNTMLAAALTAFFLLAVLRRQFAPYRRLVDGILAYSGERIALPDLRKRLVEVRRQPASEITRISDALVGMVDVIQDNMARIERLNLELYRQAARDPLTELYNRRSLTVAMNAELTRAERYKEKLSVIMADIDRFKSINDQYGHPEGDRILKEVAGVLKRNSRATDIISRWGGEEFLILCPGISLDEALVFADKLREAVASEIATPDRRVTSSFGVAQFRPGEDHDEFMARADAALYRAKEDGRNVVRAGV